MKYLFQFLLLSFTSFFVSGQPLMQKNMPVSTGGNTYAVVIGIASYLDPDIPALSFSNKDAVVFADFLMSASGGSVPQKNIKLLTDSMATIGEVDKAMRWLLNSCQEGDKVYFYFSGHGEMENATMSKNGYLICYNTPSAAFVYMGLSIDYLNDIANTLSVNTKAKVVMITDACHSGKMAGNKFRGNFFVGEQLMLKKANEIRMTSSGADQLSNENVDWGGGRGVFSYYLVNGMQGGLADTNHDGTVSLGELKTYMEHSMANDPILKNEGDVQTPVINGNTDFKLATVVASEAARVRESVKEDSVKIMMVTGALLPANTEADTDPADYFFSSLKKMNLAELTDSLQLQKLAPGEIVFSIIKKLKTVDATAENKYTQLEADLKADNETLNRFNLDVASTFLDAGQTVITNYIKGDEAELERRRYYNSSNNGYDVYPKMFAVAEKLSQSDRYYSTKAAVLLHYFSGLVLRLRIPVSDNPKPLIEQAFVEQQKALALEEYAAYIYNELGILYQYKKDYTAAEKKFIKATELSPGWAIPQSNLSGLYTYQKEYDKALKSADISDRLQPGLQSTAVNRGFISEKKGNLLFAEEYYRNAIDINARHFAPFERLGFVYINTTDYALADSFFYEADLRKKGYHFKENSWMFVNEPPVAQSLDQYYCEIDSTILKPDDIFSFFAWGVQEYWGQHYANATKILKKVISIDKKNPLVFHYMGKIFYDQQQWEQADVMFKFAMELYKDTAAFRSYIDSVKLLTTYPYDHDCVEKFFSKSYYSRIEDYFFEGNICEQWKHVEEAEMYFKKAINFNPLVSGAYVKLWRLYEDLGRYTEAERTIRDYAFVSKGFSDRELNAFYRRAITKFPDEGDWYYRLGLLLYDKAQATSKASYYDSIVYFPKINKEVFIEKEIFYRLTTDKNLEFDAAATGGPQSIEWKGPYEATELVRTPGTEEQLEMSEPIYQPRFDAVQYLKKAAELLSEKETLADINFKLGNIFLWAGSKKQAYPYFEKSLALVPNNANTRLTLVDIYVALFKNRAALQQLNYLNDSALINFEKRLLLAEFNIHAGNFKPAATLLTSAEILYPIALSEITDLRGRLNMLAGNTKEAIAFYETFINTSTPIVSETRSVFTTVNDDGSKAKGVLINITDSRMIPAYTLSRLYAKAGKNTEALEWLQSAINYGFNFSFVLKADPYMYELRKTAKWKKIIGNIPGKVYNEHSF